MDKLDTSIPVHLPTPRKVQFTRFAEREGKTASELGRDLILAFLRGKEDELRLLRELLECDGSVGTAGPGTQGDA